MGRIIFIAMVSIFLLTLQVGAGQKPAASIEWTKTSIDFGDIDHGVPVTAEFQFKNPGMFPLLITEVKPSCGCTIADFPKEPVMGGQEGLISVTFDAKEEGYFAKTITVYSNAQGGVTKLYIEGIVVK